AVVRNRISGVAATGAVLVSVGWPAPATRSPNRPKAAGPGRNPSSAPSPKEIVRTSSTAAHWPITVTTGPRRGRSRPTAVPAAITASVWPNQEAPGMTGVIGPQDSSTASPDATVAIQGARRAGPRGAAGGAAGGGPAGPASSGAGGCGRGARARAAGSAGRRGPRACRGGGVAERVIAAPPRREPRPPRAGPTPARG